MKKIVYKDISNDADNLLMIINKMYPIYKKLKKHTQVYECNYWVTMLSKIPIETKYTSNELQSLKNILNDCANICLSYCDFEMGNISMTLMNKVILLFNKD